MSKLHNTCSQLTGLCIPHVINLYPTREDIEISAHCLRKLYYWARKTENYKQRFVENKTEII
jgi:hypothetical protein